ncbi:unnamed protein product [Polarella glacialis]|uniref:Myosin motor domain-containing protein n=1 Tax=Polarella glacialis TaxID=89957 RepID=A0A813K3W1_POLGL|nr:unnamed protein product [Polarella glacialis]
MRRWRNFSNASDSSFCETVRRSAATAPGSSSQDERGPAGRKHQAIRLPRLQRQGRSVSQMRGAFVISHYAGQVEYTQDGWMDGNDAQPLAEVEALLGSASSHLVRSMACTSASGTTEDHGKRQFKSASHQHRRALDELLSTLGSARLHFIRCFRPNQQQEPGLVDRQYLLEQLRSCGTGQLMQVMHQGFPHRVSLQEVAAKFGPLLPERLRRSSPQSIVRVLMHAYGVPKGEWAVGVTQLFLKAGQLAALDDLRRGHGCLDPDILARAVRDLVRSRWRKAVNVICLVRYLTQLAMEQQRRRRRRRLRSVFLLVSFTVRLNGLVKARHAAARSVLEMQQGSAAEPSADDKTSLRVRRMVPSPARRPSGALPVADTMVPMDEDTTILPGLSQVGDCEDLQPLPPQKRPRPHPRSVREEGGILLEQAPKRRLFDQ